VNDITQRHWRSTFAGVVASAANLEVEGSVDSRRARLVCGALLLAGRQIEIRGDFLPFALAVTRTDDCVVVTALSASRVPLVEELIALLHSGLEAGRHSGRYLLTALVFEAEIPRAGGSPSLTAIELRIADERVARTLYFPYGREDGRVCLEWPIWRGDVADLEGSAVQGRESVGELGRAVEQRTQCRG
jgi:hypothetical protein